jgi:hypothetical protein
MYFTILTILGKGDGQGGWRRGGGVKGKGIEKGRGCKGSVLITRGCPCHVEVSLSRGGVLVVWGFLVARGCSRHAGVSSSRVTWGCTHRAGGVLVARRVYSSREGVHIVPGCFFLHRCPGGSRRRWEGSSVWWVPH